MIKAEIGGVELEIWFTPSFNIKTTDKEIEFQLRHLELEVFDLWRNRVIKTKATKGEKEAYLVLDALRDLVPELKIKIKEHPRPPSFPEGASSDSMPALH